MKRVLCDANSVFQFAVVYNVVCTNAKILIVLACIQWFYNDSGRQRHYFG